MTRLTLLCLWASMALGALADDVVLKDGRVLSGRILEEDGKTLVLQLPFGTVYIPLSAIERIAFSPPLDDTYQEKRQIAVSVEDFEALLDWCHANGHPTREVERALKAARLAELRREHPDDWCLICGGEGTVDCESCSARGRQRIDCSRCGGLEEIACPDCLATPGKWVCRRCQGEGRVDAICRSCRGEGRVTCSLCGGDKLRGCPNCEGTGSVTRYETRLVQLVDGSWVQAKFPVVSVCGGCGGSGRVVCTVCDAHGMQPCQVCQGDGTVDAACPECRGRAIRECPTCRGVERIGCPECRGRGTMNVDCEACGGLGRVTCPACGGKGWGRD